MKFVILISLFCSTAFSSPRFEVRTAPIAMLAPTFNGTALGAHAIWAESFVEDALYVSAHYYNEDYKSYPHAFLGHENVTGNKMSVDIGKRWIVYEKVSSMLGFGIESHNHHVVRISDFSSPTGDDNNSGFFHIEYKLGYFF